VTSQVLDQALLAISQWMTGSFALAAAGCLLWGMVSVLLSPCHMASIPLMVGYVAGQGRLIQGREAASYSVSFTSGLFITITAVGAVCALMGRMLGDIGPYWTLLVGAVLIWVCMDMLGVSACSLSGGLMGRMKVRGRSGAFVLGLAYGLLSGSCTFGFIAPILAIITVQERFSEGLALIVIFAAGHCLPLLAAGSSTAFVQRWLERGSGRAGAVFRKASGVLIGLLGVYFVLQPLLNR